MTKKGEANLTIIILFVVRVAVQIVAMNAGAWCIYLGFSVNENLYEKVCAICDRICAKRCIEKAQKRLNKQNNKIKEGQSEASELTPLK